MFSAWRVQDFHRDSYEPLVTVAHAPIILPIFVSMNQLKNIILIKFNIGEFYETLSNHFKFHLDVTVLTTTLHKSIG
jgi:hypothetical protein